MAPPHSRAEIAALDAVVRIAKALERIADVLEKSSPALAGSGEEATG